METPFNMIICGMTNYGKTYYLLNMIEKRFKKHFDYIILICPTFTWNKTYLDWKYINDPDFIAVECDQDNVDKILQIVQVVYKGTNSLIILDDCASSQDVKNRTSELVKLAFSARHFGLSTIVITQQLNSISKPYRDNVARVVSFYNPDEDDMNVIFRRYLGNSTKTERTQIIEKLKNIKYATLEINLRYPFDYKIITPLKSAINGKK